MMIIGASGESQMKNKWRKAHLAVKLVQKLWSNKIVFYIFSENKHK